MPRKNNPLNPDEVSQARRRIWQHNSYSGHCAMMKQQLRAIVTADSVTPDAKEVAKKMIEQVGALAARLKVRKDP